MNSVSNLNPVANQKIGNVRASKAAKDEARKLFAVHASVVLVDLGGCRVAVQVITIDFSWTRISLPRFVPGVSLSELLVNLKSL